MPFIDRMLDVPVVMPGQVTCWVVRRRSTHVKPWVQNVVTAVDGVRDGFSGVVSPKPHVAASFRPTVAAVANCSPDAAASQEPAVAAAAKLSCRVSFAIGHGHLSLRFHTTRR